VLLLCPPLALVFSLLGATRDDRKEYAVTALLGSGALIIAFLLLLH